MPAKRERGFELDVKSYSTKRVKCKTEKFKLSQSSQVASDLLVRSNELTPSHELSQPSSYVDENAESTKSKYRERKVADAEEWTTIRDELVNVSCSLEEPPSYCCSLCSMETPNPIRCLDCHVTFVCCSSCELGHHSHVLHKPEIWNGFMYIPFTATSTKCWSRIDHTCESSRVQSIELIDTKGRSHYAVFTFCEHESAAATLVRFGFWPSSPVRPCAAFSLELLKMMHMLTLECAVSVKGFVQTLRWMNNLSSCEASHLYSLLIGDTVSEFRWFYRRTQTTDLVDLSAKLRTFKCPACPTESGGVVTISMDGNFGLVRKSNSGESMMPPLYQDVYFIDTLEADAFVNTCKNDSAGDKECSHFLAGNAVRSRSRNANLDVRGVFGSVCRHEYPVLFMDMKHGERLAYPVLLLQKLLGLKPDGCDLQIVYDIGCVLTRHMNLNQQGMLEQITIGVPVFHAYGHGASCQVNFSCRHKAGFGLTDGEGTERLWSYLRPLATITKEMTPSHRIDLLNDALIHYAMRKTAGIAKWLGMRAERAAVVEQASSQKLHEFVIEMRVSSVDDVARWRDEYRQQLSRSKTGKDRSSWELVYATHLRDYFSLRNKIMTTTDAQLAITFGSQLDSLHATLLKAEHQHKFARWLPTSSKYLQLAHSLDTAEKEKVLRQLQRDASERAFLVSLLSKYCDGQSVANRLSAQVKRATNALNKGINVYNATVFLYGISTLPEQIKFEQAADPSSPIYSSLHDSEEAHESVPATMKLKALELLDIHERAVEEKQRVSDDFNATLKHFNNLHKSLSSATPDLDVSRRARVLRKLLALEQLMQELWVVAQKFVSELPVRLTFPLLNTSAIALDTFDSTDRHHLDDLDLDLIDSDSDDED